MGNLEKPLKGRDPSSELSKEVSPKNAKANFGFVVTNSNELSHASDADRPERAPHPAPLAVAPRKIELSQLGVCGLLQTDPAGLSPSRVKPFFAPEIAEPQNPAKRPPRASAARLPKKVAPSEIRRSVARKAPPKRQAIVDSGVRMPPRTSLPQPPAQSYKTPTRAATGAKTPNPEFTMRLRSSAKKSAAPLEVPKVSKSKNIRKGAMTGRPSTMKDFLGNNTGTTPKKLRQARLAVCKGAFVLGNQVPSTRQSTRAQKRPPPRRAGPRATTVSSFEDSLSKGGLERHVRKGPK